MILPANLLTAAHECGASAAEALAQAPEPWARVALDRLARDVLAQLGCEDEDTAGAFLDGVMAGFHDHRAVAVNTGQKQEPLT